ADAETTEAPGGSVDRDAELAAGTPFPAFAEQPRVGDVLLLGLTSAVPNCAVQLDFQGEVAGIGVDPRQPPLVWEALTGAGWAGCGVTDEAGGLNRSGPVVVHGPAGHETRVVDGRRAGWLRARVVAAAPGQPGYSASPLVRGLSAGTVGGTVEAVH